MTLLLLIALAQGPRTAICDPTRQSDCVSTTLDGGHRGLDVNVIGGYSSGGSSSGGGTIDGGDVRALQGKSNDGGYDWHVDVEQLGGSAIAAGAGASNAATLRVVTSSDSALQCNAGTNLNTSALALDATLTGRTQKTQITDGTHDGTVKAASTLPAATDTALVVTLRDTATVSGTVTTTPPSNASTNVAQFGGTNVSTGTGAGGAGIPRVTISNDSSLAANQSTNVAQVNGVATQTGAGASGTGTIRVMLASDSALAANQSVNVAQVAGATTSTAASGVQLVGVEGRAGTSFETTAGVLDHNLKNVSNAAVATAASGVQKVGIVGNAGAAVDAVLGAAVPANALAMGVRDNGNLNGLLQCDKSAVITAAAVATTQIVALSGSTVIYVCGFSVTGGGAAGTMQWKYGTGTTCGTGTTNISGAYTTAIGGTIGYGGSLGYVFKTTAGQALCITMATTSATANGVLTYAQF